MGKSNYLRDFMEAVKEDFGGKLTDEDRLWIEQGELSEAFFGDDDLRQSDYMAEFERANQKDFGTPATEPTADTPDGLDSVERDFGLPQSVLDTVPDGTPKAIRQLAIAETQRELNRLDPFTSQNEINRRARELLTANLQRFTEADQRTRSSTPAARKVDADLAHDRIHRKTTAQCAISHALERAGKTDRHTRQICEMETLALVEKVGHRMTDPELMELCESTTRTCLDRLEAGDAAFVHYTP